MQRSLTCAWSKWRDPLQADGTWVSYWDGQEAGSRGGGCDEGNGVDGYDAFDGYYDNGYATGRYRNRVGRNSKRCERLSFGAEHKTVKSQETKFRIKDLLSVGSSGTRESRRPGCMQRENVPENERRSPAQELLSDGGLRVIM